MLGLQYKSASEWFLKLRWFAFFGQLLILWLAVAYFKLSLPWLTILLLLSVIPATNLFYWYISRQPTLAQSKFWSSNSIPALLIIDTCLLTAVLHQAGGPMNPFSIIYLLHVVLATILLTSAWSWCITGLTCLAYGFLFIDSRSVPEWHAHGAHHGFSLHLHGMLFAFIVAAILVVYFVNKIVNELRNKERRLERLENLTESHQRLTALTALSADVAHELGTPLATLAVVAEEMRYKLSQNANSNDLDQDIQIINTQVERCKANLQKLSLNSGAVVGESLVTVKVKDLLNAACQDLCELENIEFIENQNAELTSVPKAALVRTLRVLIKNALEATNYEPRSITISFSNSDQSYILRITDTGCGMSSETMQSLGQAFFSTKGAKGMGLGFYLAKLTLEQLGGEITVVSQLNKGTEVKLTFPKRSSTNTFSLKAA